jgi:DNA polymerase III subunit delta'
VSTSAPFSEHPEAARLLDAALREGPAHAYLFHGPPGVGKSAVARRFAHSLLETTREFHPDLYELDPLGEMIRIDAIRELRRDLHMRPFEAGRRVYLIHRAHLLNEDAADALLKDLEEPPEYAVIVLIAEDLGPLPETILSRCQLVPFRRLSERSIRELVDARVPQLGEEERASLARVAAGRLDRLERLLDPAASARRDALIEQARAVYRDPSFDATDAAAALIANAQSRADEARALEEARIEGLDLTARESDQQVKRAARGAEGGGGTEWSGEAERQVKGTARGADREGLLAQLEELEAWYRDLVAVAVGAEAAAIHLDKLPALREDATRERLAGAERAAEAVREAWRRLEELNLAPQLALEAVFIAAARELAA